MKIIGISAVPVTSEWKVPDYLAPHAFVSFKFKTYFGTSPQTFTVKAEANPWVNAGWYENGIQRNHMVYERDYDNNSKTYVIEIGEKRSLPLS